jgi:hypothetical protein
MTGADVPSTPSVRQGLADAYERLRLAATAAESQQRTASLQGLGVLICKGMAAWMRACSTVTASSVVAPPTTVSDVVQMLPSVRHEVVDVLAAIALTITPEVRT